MKTQPRQHIPNKYNTCTVVTSPVYIGSNWVQASLKSSGKLFHKTAAAYLKLFLPYLEVHTWDIFKMLLYLKL